MRPFLAPLLLLAGCSGGPKDPAASASAFDTVQATFDTLVRAIRAKDLELYKQCFTTKAHERGESGLAKFEQKPEEAWKELQGMFSGPLSIKDQETRGDTTRVSIEAPEAEGGGIGGMTFQRVDGKWLVRNW
ncbi:MAG: hypothetical protein OER88_01740 [Planctomycetota bacterium]|nr:hypothetical protein [Planctomycetota bacterium]